MKTELKIKLYGITLALSSLIYMGCYIADNEFHKVPVKSEIVKDKPNLDYMNVVNK